MGKRRSKNIFSQNQFIKTPIVAFIIFIISLFSFFEYQWQAVDNNGQITELNIEKNKDNKDFYFQFTVNSRTYTLPYFTNHLIENIGDGPQFADIKDLLPPYKSYEHYSFLDELKRVGEADSILGLDTLPTEKRENIQHISPSGFVQKKYPFIKGNSLFNRSHLIAYQLSAENDRKENLMTGTRDFNQIGMTRYEEHIGSYIRATGNHVRYRVTPVFLNNELVARGVIMEGFSLEDKGEGINFAVYIHNVQRGVEIDYLTGQSTTKPILEDYADLHKFKPKKWPIPPKEIG